MWLIAVYILLVLVGDVAAYVVGISIERTWPAASLPVFLGLYFLFFWVAWLLAVRMTRPKALA